MDLRHPREMTQNTTHRHTLAGNINSIKVSSQECWGMLMFGAEATQLCGTKVTKKQSSWRGEGTHWYTLYTGVAPITPLAMTSPTTTCNKNEIQPNEYGTYVLHVCVLFSIHKWLPFIWTSLFPGLDSKNPVIIQGSFQLEVVQFDSRILGLVWHDSGK